MSAVESLVSTYAKKFSDTGHSFNFELEPENYMSCDYLVEARNSKSRAHLKFLISIMEGHCFQVLIDRSPDDLNDIELLFLDELLSLTIDLAILEEQALIYTDWDVSKCPDHVKAIFEKHGYQKYQLGSSLEDFLSVELDYKFPDFVESCFTKCLDQNYFNFYLQVKNNLKAIADQMPTFRFSKILSRWHVTSLYYDILLCDSVFNGKISLEYFDNDHWIPIETDLKVFLENKKEENHLNVLFSPNMHFFEAMYGYLGRNIFKQMLEHLMPIYGVEKIENHFAKQVKENKKRLNIRETPHFLFIKIFDSVFMIDETSEVVRFYEKFEDIDAETVIKDAMSIIAPSIENALLFD